MSDHPETTALRLAEAATEGPWHAAVSEEDRYAQVRSMRQGFVGPVAVAEMARWVTRDDNGMAQAAANAAHIAHAHPGRVRAWLGCVARLRERVAEGHASDCVRRLGDDAAVYRLSDDGDTHHRVRVGDLPCKCGHEDDLAALTAVDAEG